MFIVLDRDGVINYDSHAYIKSPAEWLPIPGSLEAIASLKGAGHIVVVATNQSGIGRGYYTHEILADIHAKMEHLLAGVGTVVDGIFYCPHHPDDKCNCRKPESGMYDRIAERFNPDWSQSISVGDSLRDLQAAKAVGCPGALVRTGNGADVEAKTANLDGIAIYDDLAAFAAAKGVRSEVID